MKNCPRACALLVVGAVALVSGGPLELQGQALSQLAIVGGMLIDGHEGVPIQNSVILVDGDRITHVGTVSDTEIPSTARVIDTNGLTVMPGLNEAHAHLIVVGHGFYDEYFPRYMGRWREIMEISARQLLMAGVTTARDLGAQFTEYSGWRIPEAYSTPGAEISAAGRGVVLAGVDHPRRGAQQSDDVSQLDDLGPGAQHHGYRVLRKVNAHTGLHRRHSCSNSEYTSWSIHLPRTIISSRAIPS